MKFNYFFVTIEFAIFKTFKIQNNTILFLYLYREKVCLHQPISNQLIVSVMVKGGGKLNIQSKNYIQSKD